MVPNFFHLRIMEPTVCWGTFNVAEMFWYPSPDLCLDTILLKLYGQFLRPHGLVFTLACTVNCGTLYRQVCAFPNHVQSIEFTTGGLQSSCRNISRMINGNRMHLSSISSLIAKSLNTYVNKVFLFNILIHLQTLKKAVLTFLLWGAVCSLQSFTFFNLIYFRMRLT